MEELINKLKQYEDPEPDSEWKYGKNYGLMVAENEIKKTIISCGYCKYHEEAEGGYEYCHKWLRETYSDWYCSRGGQE